MTDSVLMEVDNDPQVGEKRKADKGKAPLSAADESKKNQMWVEKYRPSRLADVAAHKDIIDTISRLTTEDKLPHLLLYGPPGTGKTSTILAVARELYGASFAQMVLELNASDGTRLAREGPRGRTSDSIARRLLPSGFQISLSNFPEFPDSRELPSHLNFSFSPTETLTSV